MCRSRSSPSSTSAYSAASNFGAVGVGDVGERIVGRRLAVQDLVQPLVRVHDRTVAVDVQQAERHSFGDAAQQLLPRAKRFVRSHLVADVDALGHDAAELRVVEPVVVRELEPDEAAVRVRVPQPHAARVDPGVASMSTHDSTAAARSSSCTKASDGRPTISSRGQPSMLVVASSTSVNTAVSVLRCSAKRAATGPSSNAGAGSNSPAPTSTPIEHAVPFPQVEQVERDLGAGTDQADTRAARAAGPHLFPGGDHRGAIIRRDQQHRGPAGQRADLAAPRASVASARTRRARSIAVTRARGVARRSAASPSSTASASSRLFSTL